MTSTALSQEILSAARTQTGESLDELNRRSPVLVVFLRHCGCAFAREALDDVAAQRLAISDSGTAIVLVHMQAERDAAELFKKYHVDDLPRISDPEQKLYQAFEVGRGSLWQVAGPGMWWRAVTALVSGHLPGVPNADVYQLPGAFLIHNGAIISAFRAQSSADRPDYTQVAQCPLASSTATPNR